MNSTAETIKESLTMSQVAEFYGFHPDRAGFIRCPFHAGDNSASLKIYSGKGGFHCFGCNTNGSVIDFVMKLFDCDFKTALQKLNSDFNLGLYKQSYRERKSARSNFMAKQAAIKERDQRKKEAEQEYWNAFDRWCAADAVFRKSQEFSDEWVEALKMLPQLSYELTIAEGRMRELDITS